MVMQTDSVSVVDSSGIAAAVFCSKRLCQEINQPQGAGDSTAWRGRLIVLQIVDNGSISGAVACSEWWHWK